MRYLYFPLLSLGLIGAGCASTPEPTAVVGQQVTECRVAIDISGAAGNTSDYNTATFTYPCDWKNTSSGTSMSITAPETSVGITYPSPFEGGLPMDGTEEPLQIMGQAHTRYITQNPDDAMGPITSEMIRGPVTDTLGVRPYYQYPAGNELGNQMAAVFASLKLE